MLNILPHIYILLINRALLYPAVTALIKEDERPSAGSSFLKAFFFLLF